jgi:hypothetical protein
MLIDAMKSAGPKMIVSSRETRRQSHQRRSARRSLSAPDADTPPAGRSSLDLAEQDVQPRHLLGALHLGSITQSSAAPAPSTISMTSR